ncbi:membrane steroid-binding protein 1 [Drosophila mojavensis]|uniref:Cytochrome b5 heme-binding domain-containing protein n=1 Tax=Drosophila mojavensis TaxID=7230 RepID=B4KKV5_DROMO|nr:membrane steroid-binding protein 1 [Drosophila mojavensis]EDW11685.1 uncharacterized protein Dmoj_GI17278 [Drosophila mojavensis]
MSSLPSTTWSDQLRDALSSPLGILALTCIVGYMAYMHVRRDYPTYDDEDYEKEGHVEIPAPLQNLRMTKKKLEQYDSQNPKRRYLIALQGIIYDVSGAPHDFGPNGSYESLSGTDILWFIRSTARFESRDFNTYLDEWKTMLEDHFYVAGVLVSDNDQTDSEPEGSSQYDSANENNEYDNKVEMNKGYTTSDKVDDDKVIDNEYLDTDINGKLEENSSDGNFEDADNTLMDCSDGDKTISTM